MWKCYWSQWDWSEAATQMTEISVKIYKKDMGREFG